jgi:hypothetical protein
MRKLTTRQARQLAKLRKTHGAGPGRPKGATNRRRRPHCPCGAMTRERASKRGHVCS